MEVHFARNQEDMLNDLAARTGRGTEELVQKAVAQMLEYDTHFLAAVAEPDNGEIAENYKAAEQQIEIEFASLATQWLKETTHLSLIRDKILSPVHLQIIALGHKAVPLILRELRDRPSHWFVALQALTKNNPASGASSPREARDKWLAWGEARGLI